MKELLPLEGWHKENFDGVEKGNHGPLGCGGIIRNSYGGGVAAFYHPLGYQTNHYAEASVARHTMKLALDMGVKKICLEADSNNIIRCIKGVIQPSWTIANIIKEMFSSLGNFDRIYITYEYREENFMADWFANEAVRRDKVMILNLGRNILEEVKILIELEKIQGGTGDI